MFNRRTEGSAQSRIAHMLPPVMVFIHLCHIYNLESAPDDFLPPSLPYPCRRSVGKLPKSFASLASAGCCCSLNPAAKPLSRLQSRTNSFWYLLCNEQQNPGKWQGWLLQNSSPGRISQEPLALLTAVDCGFEHRDNREVLELKDCRISWRLFWCLEHTRSSLFTSSKPPGPCPFCREILRSSLNLNSLLCW